MKNILSILACSLCSLSFAQENKLPYHEIPEPPEQYNAGNVAARLIDGLGFRYYWASEGLREEDLAFKPSKGARSTEETLKHIYDMSQSIFNVVMQTQDEAKKATNYMDLRKNTLENFKAISDQLKKYSDEDLNQLIITFGRGGNALSFPFWNLINGQIADCLWHTGQVVTFRRSSGNPISNKINVFTGTVRD